GELADLAPPSLACTLRVAIFSYCRSANKLADLAYLADLRTRRWRTSRALVTLLVPGLPSAGSLPAGQEAASRAKSSASFRNAWKRPACAAGWPATAARMTAAAAAPGRRCSGGGTRGSSGGARLPPDQNAAAAQQPAAVPNSVASAAG